MGLVYKELNDFQLSSGEKILIELNYGGSIHIHINNMRVNCSINEFEELVSVIKNGRNKLNKVKLDVHEE